MNEDRRALDRSVAEDSAVGGDPRDAKARSDLVRDAIGQLDGVILGHDGELRGGAEGPIGLGAVDPDALSDAAPGDAVADRVDDARAITVRDHTRVRHPVANPVAALLRITRIDARNRNPDPYLTRARLRIRHLADFEHVRSGSRSFVPSREHPRHLRPPLSP